MSIREAIGAMGEAVRNEIGRQIGEQVGAMREEIYSEFCDGLLPELLDGFKAKFVEQDVERLDGQVAELRSEIETLKSTVDAQAAAIAALRDEISLAVNLLESRGGKVVDLDLRRAQ